MCLVRLPRWKYFSQWAHFTLPPATVFSEEALLQDSMSCSLVLLHIVGALEHFEALRALRGLWVHVLDPDVTRQVYARYQLSAMRTRLLACKWSPIIFCQDQQTTQYNFVQFFCRIWWSISTIPKLWAPLLYCSILVFICVQNFSRQTTPQF